MVVTTKTKTIAVNAAFLEEIKNDNVHLQEYLQFASSLLHRNKTEPVSVTELADITALLRDQLATHFSLEEAFGYLEEAVDAAPHLSTRAFSLRDEHSELYQTIAKIADDCVAALAVENDDRVQRLLKRFKAFCRRFKRHEQLENELIVESLYDDIGVGD